MIVFWSIQRPGLDHVEIVGVADSRAMPSGCSYSRPQTLGKSVYSPEYCNGTAGEAGTRDANQDRDGGAGGVRYERGNIT
jgi:hypothetical protein